MPLHLESNHAYPLIERIPFSQAPAIWASVYVYVAMVTIDGYHPLRNDPEELLVCAEPVTLYSKKEK